MIAKWVLVCYVCSNPHPYNETEEPEPKVIKRSLLTVGPMWF